VKSTAIPLPSDPTTDPHAGPEAAFLGNPALPRVFKALRLISLPGLACLALCGLPAQAQISVVNTGASVRTSGSGSQSFNIPFDAGATADAIVLLLSSESNAAAGQAAITYAGFAFTPVIDHVGAQPSIWYLNLSSTTYTSGPATLTLDLTGVTSANGYGLGIVSVTTGGLDLMPHATNKSSSPMGDTSGLTVGLTTTLESFVIAGHRSNSGSGGASANTPMTQIFGQQIGSSQGAAGYQTNVAAGNPSFSFTSANQQRNSSAAAFVVAPGGPTARITSFSRTDGGLWELTLEGEPNTGYEFRSSPTLEFDPGAPVGGLTAGDPALGTIVGPSNSILVTDGDGLGSARMALAGPRNFVRAGVVPPNTLISEDFESATSPGLPDGWTRGRNNPPDNGSLSTTVWETGTPANVGPVPPGVPLPSGSKCAATNIAGNYFEPNAPSNNPTPVTDIWLRTPPIALGTATAATLRFMQWTEIESVSGTLDYGSIRILDASDDSQLAVIENRSIDGSTNGWKEYSRELPAAAFTAAVGTIKIEFRFEADDLGSFAGWYIDDLSLTAPAFP